MFIQRKSQTFFFLLDFITSFLLCVDKKKHLDVFFFSFSFPVEQPLISHSGSTMCLFFYWTEEIYFTFIKAQMEDENSGCEPSRGCLSFYNHRSVSKCFMTQSG